MIAKKVEMLKVYAESFKGQEHLRRIQSEASTIIDDAFTAAGA